MKNGNKFEMTITITDQTILYGIMTALDETDAEIAIPEDEYDDFIDDIKEYVIDQYEYYGVDYTPNYINLVNDTAKIYGFIKD